MAVLTITIRFYYNIQQIYRYIWYYKQKGTNMKTRVSSDIETLGRKCEPR
ncbi:hypothetical protein HMPREF0239_01637 [Clostridium sp. ATCC BAA-442]|nr:hypothetical protein HMPREF0239_01637 [Clostridium sp. ATCC BAA-442]